MSPTIVISIGNFQIRSNALSLSFKERESGKWPLGQSDFNHNYLISNDKLMTINYQQFLLYSERKVVIYRKLII